MPCESQEAFVSRSYSTAGSLGSSEPRVVSCAEQETAAYRCLPVCVRNAFAAKTASGERRFRESRSAGRSWVGLGTLVLQRAQLRWRPLKLQRLYERRAAGQSAPPHMYNTRNFLPLLARRAYIAVQVCDLSSHGGGVLCM